MPEPITPAEQNSRLREMLAAGAEAVHTLYLLGLAPRNGPSALSQRATAWERLEAWEQQAKVLLEEVNS